MLLGSNGIAKQQRASIAHGMALLQVLKALRFFKQRRLTPWTARQARVLLQLQRSDFIHHRIGTAKEQQAKQQRGPAISITTVTSTVNLLRSRWADATADSYTEQ